MKHFLSRIAVLSLLFFTLQVSAQSSVYVDWIDGSLPTPPSAMDLSAPKKNGDIYQATEFNALVKTLYKVSNLNGNVGIGTQSPTDTLHVAGTTRVDSLSKSPVCSDADGVLANCHDLLSCQDGQILKWNGTDWTCGNDQNGSGSGNLPICAQANEILRWNGSAWICSVDQGIETFILDGTTLKLKLENGTTKEVDLLKLITDNMSDIEIFKLDGNILTLKLENGTTKEVDLLKLITDNLRDIQTFELDGNTLKLQLDKGGIEKTVDLSTLIPGGAVDADWKILTDGRMHSIPTGFMGIGTTDPTNTLHIAGTTRVESLSKSPVCSDDNGVLKNCNEVLSCQNGQILKWNNSQWVCANDDKGTGGGTTLPNCQKKDQVLRWNQSNSSWNCSDEQKIDATLVKNILTIKLGDTVKNIDLSTLTINTTSEDEDWKVTPLGNMYNIPGRAVGIGTQTPIHQLHVKGDGYFSDNLAVGSGSDASGDKSLATGGGTASGYNTTAHGVGTVALGDNATALGAFTTAEGQASLALGQATYTHDKAFGSFAFGLGSETFADASLAGGYQSRVFEGASNGNTGGVALGYEAISNSEAGFHAFNMAMKPAFSFGYQTQALASGNMALGQSAQNTKANSVLIATGFDNKNASHRKDLFIASNGYVGIGNDDPSGDLTVGAKHLEGDIIAYGYAPEVAVVHSGNDANGKTFQTGNATIQFSNSTGSWDQGLWGEDGSFRLSNHHDIKYNQVMTATRWTDGGPWSGKVGIGTSRPTHKIDVNGYGRVRYMNRVHAPLVVAKPYQNGETGGVFYKIPMPPTGGGGYVCVDTNGNAYVHPTKCDPNYTLPTPINVGDEQVDTVGDGPVDIFIP